MIQVSSQENLYTSPIEEHSESSIAFIELDSRPPRRPVIVEQTDELDCSIMSREIETQSIS
jgi:hypothetical protein